ncbi:glycosyltransferase family 4 protein [Aureibaculum sp. 2210JD6-5]|uniref:glycosyltransferase family 4 protein n=1 Tax=Aureibaculum sp. 2210JD6-5 TaxID=3103957 RepID=UPI002AAD99CE|nr:glycosyltransferase family 4 protein [Aureibaculum sp. 2210JD6-5]MDY7394091.1 glycosyltransferase family 4 protein [Aureibaculum sp. 2210JD6-5]
MKVLYIVSSNLYYFEGAYSNRMRGLFEGMIKRNIEIYFLVTDGYKDWKEYVFHKKQKYPKGITIQYIGFPYQIRILKKLKFNTIFKRLIINKQKTIQKNTNFDYGWTTIGLNHDAQLESISLFKSQGLKIIQNMSEFPSLMLSDLEYKKYLDLILPKIDIMFLMTKSLMKFYGEPLNHSAKLYHIPMTVDIDRFNKSKSISNNDNFVISYVGLMRNKKDGVDILIKAFAIVINKFPNVLLKLIGPKKPDQDYLKQVEFIKSEKLDDKVEYLGKVSREKIPDLLINSDCLVLARPDSIQAQFGFPTKLGEYLATGNPVVVTSVGEIPDYLQDNISAFIAKPGSVEDVASKILSILTDRENAKIVGERGFQIANEHFNAEIQSTKIVAILEDNLNN